MWGAGKRGSVWKRARHMHGCGRRGKRGVFAAQLTYEDTGWGAGSPPCFSCGNSCDVASQVQDDGSMDQTTISSETP